MAIQDNETRPDPGRWEVTPIGAPETTPVPVVTQVEDETPPFVVAASAAPVGERLPRTATRSDVGAPFVWVGAHGGAGTTSLAAESPGVVLNGVWPAPELGWPDRVVLVCRADMAGLDRVTRFLHEAAAGLVPDLEVLALVTVADAPTKASKAVRTRLRELSGTVPVVLSVPWIATWRDTPYTPASPALKVAARIVALAEKENHQ